MANSPRKKAVKKKRTSVIDFSKTTSRRAKIPNDDYLFKISDAWEGISGTGNPTAYFEAKIPKGNYKGFQGYYNCSLKPKALWKLRQFLEALGMEDLGKKLNIDWTEVIGKYFGATVEEDTYQGKVRSKIIDVFPSSELEEDEEETDEGDSEEEEVEEDEEGDEEEGDDEDNDEEEEEDEEEDEEEEKPPRRKKKR